MKQSSAKVTKEDVDNYKPGGKNFKLYKGKNNQGDTKFGGNGRFVGDGGPNVRDMDDGGAGDLDCPLGG